MRRTLIVLSLLALSLGYVSAAMLTGKVVGKNGKPIQGANVWVSWLDGRKTLELGTDAGGNLLEADLTPRPQDGSAARIIAYAPGYALTAAGLEQRGTVIALHPGATISGIVVDAQGKTCAGVAVRLVGCGVPSNKRYEDEDAYAAVPEEWLARFTVLSAADGRWTLPGVPLAGAAELELIDNRYAHERREITLVAGKKAQAVRFAVRPGAVVTGRVLKPDGTPAGDG